MSDTFYEVVLFEPQQAHAAVVHAYEWTKPRVAAGDRVVLRVELEEETRAIRLNKEYWGYVLRPISEQAQVDGMGADAEGWHYFYKKMFLGYEFTKVRVPGKKRPVVRRELRSTTELTNREMREYMEQVRAHAATTFTVEFPAMERDIAPPRKGIGHTPKTTIDAETGEILETTA